MVNPRHSIDYTNTIRTDIASHSASSIKTDVLVPRWITLSNDRGGRNIVSKSFQTNFKILWSGIIRDDTILAEIALELSNTVSQSTLFKVRKRLLQKEVKIGWDFITYAIKTTRVIYAVKFHVYQKSYFVPGTDVVLQGLQKKTFLNGLKATVIEYLESKGKYLVQPKTYEDIATKARTSGILMVNSKNIFLPTGDNDEVGKIRLWTFAALYCGTRDPLFEVKTYSNEHYYDAKDLVCHFLEKILSISSGSRLIYPYDWPVDRGRTMCFQEHFGPILLSQMIRFNNPKNWDNIITTEDTKPTQDNHNDPNSKRLLRYSHQYTEENIRLLSNIKDKKEADSLADDLTIDESASSATTPASSVRNQQIELDIATTPAGSVSNQQIQLDID